MQENNIPPSHINIRQHNHTASHTGEDDVSTLASTQSGQEVSTIRTTNDLKDRIRELLEIDGQLRVIKKEKALLDKKKKLLSKELMGLMKEKEIDSFTTKKSVLVYKKSTRRPMNKKTISNLLQEYYRDDAEEAMEVRNFIFENLPEKTVESLVLKDTEEEEVGA